MTPKQASKARLRARRKERTAAGPFTPAPTPQADDDGPTTLGRAREGASIGRSADSTAGGAAGQLKPKDER